VACGGSTSQSICTTCGTEWKYNGTNCVPAGSGGGSSGGGTSGGGEPPSKNVELTNQEIVLDAMGIFESLIGLGLSVYLLTSTKSGILIPGISAVSALVSISSGIAGLVIRDNDEILNSLSYVSTSFGIISVASGAYGLVNRDPLTGSGVGENVNVNALEIGEGLGSRDNDLTHVRTNPLNREESLPRTRIEPHTAFNTHF